MLRTNYMEPVQSRLEPRPTGKKRSSTLTGAHSRRFSETFQALYLFQRSHPDDGQISLTIDASEATLVKQGLAVDSEQIFVFVLKRFFAPVASHFENSSFGNRFANDVRNQTTVRSHGRSTTDGNLRFAYACSLLRAWGLVYAIARLCQRTPRLAFR